MAPMRVRAMLNDVLGALASAHAAGIVHRDVKPGNVLLSQNSTMKVADFGIAKANGTANTSTGQIVGTMAYMSPARVAGAPASVADDLYAVGVVGYEALIGRRPFPQDDPVSLLRAILDDPPPPIEAVRHDVDPALSAVINGAMTRDGSGFDSADQMRAVLALPRALGWNAGPARPPRSWPHRCSSRAICRGTAQAPQTDEPGAETAAGSGGVRRSDRDHACPGARSLVDDSVPAAGQQQHRRPTSASGQFAAAVADLRSGSRRAAGSPQEETRRQRQRQRQRRTDITPVATRLRAVTITGVSDNSEQAVLVEQRDRILIITINRPQARTP